MTFDQIVEAVYRNDIGALGEVSRHDVNLTDEDGRTPLMHAVLAENPNSDVVRLLLERGADPSVAESDQRWTALHFTARDENAQLVRLLLDAGSEVDARDDFGDTPLWRAVFNAGGDLETVELLLSRGADAARENDNGVSPFDLAREMGRADLIEVLSA